MTHTPDDDNVAVFRWRDDAPGPVPGGGPERETPALYEALVRVLMDYQDLVTHAEMVGTMELLKVQIIRDTDDV